MASSDLLSKEEGYTILIGDGVKQVKKGRYMSGVKKLFQESENSSKPEDIFGHMFGGIGILAGSAAKWLCIPLHINLQDEIQTILSWKNKEKQPQTHGWSSNVTMHIITKSKKSCIAYRQPEAKKSSRERSSKKGDAIKLEELFSSKSKEFLETSLNMYLSS